MLAAFRAFGKSWVAKVLFGVLALAFVGWGAGSSQLGGAISNDVIRAGRHHIEASTFQTMFNNALQNIGQQQGQSVTPQDALQAGFDQEMLRELAQANSMWELVRRLGIRPSDKLITQQVAKIQAFVSPITGQFDKGQYLNVLKQNGYTSKADQDRFLDEVGDRYAEQQFTTGVLAGLAAPKTYGAVLAASFVQQRDAEFFALPVASVGAVAPPTDAQLTAFMNQFSAQLQRPPTRVISLVRLSQAGFAPAVTVSDADVQKAYDARKATMSTPEKRAFVQMTLRNASDAAVLNARLARGEDPKSAAKAIGGDAITYPDQEKGTIPDQAVANAVFSMQPGQTSAPITTQNGVSVVRLVRITPAHTKSLAEARGDLEQELRQDGARQRVFDMVRKYNDAHDSGADLVKAAQAAGATVYNIGPITQDGKDQTGRPNPSLTPQMLKDAFAKPQGSETDLIDLGGGGEYYALRVDKVNPASLPALNEVRPMLSQAWMHQEIGKRLQAKSEGLTSQLKSGKSMDAVAASVGAHTQRVTGVSRLTLQQHADLGREMIGALFGQKPGVVFTAPGADGQSLLIARVTSVRPGDAGNVAALAGMANGQAAQATPQEFREMVMAAAQARIKPKVDRTKALKAIGVDPKTAPGATPGAAPGAAPAGKASLAK